jgi:hypothetical protein
VGVSSLLGFEKIEKKKRDEVGPPKKTLHWGKSIYSVSAVFEFINPIYPRMKITIMVNATSLKRMPVTP